MVEYAVCRLVACSSSRFSPETAENVEPLSVLAVCCQRLLLLVAIVKNLCEPTMEVIVKSGEKIETLNMSETMIEKDVVGAIYEMAGRG